MRCAWMRAWPSVADGPTPCCTLLHPATLRGTAYVRRLTCAHNASMTCCCCCSCCCRCCWCCWCCWCCCCYHGCSIGDCGARWEGASSGHGRRAGPSGKPVAAPAISLSVPVPRGGSCLRYGCVGSPYGCCTRSMLEPRPRRGSPKGSSSATGTITRGAMVYDWVGLRGSLESNGAS